MAALVAGEVIPVAVKQVGEDLGLHLAVVARLVAVDVAAIAVREVVIADCRAVWIYRRREDDRLSIRSPLRVVSLGPDEGHSLQVGGGARRRVKVCHEDLLMATFIRGEKQNALAIRRKLRAAVSGMRYSELDGIAAFNFLQPQLRGFGVLFEVDGGDGVG